MNVAPMAEFGQSVVSIVCRRRCSTQCPATRSKDRWKYAAVVAFPWARGQKSALGESHPSAKRSQRIRPKGSLLCSGKSGRGGKDTVGSYKKFRHMLWCLAEAMREIDRRFLLQDGVVAVMHRDERMSGEPAAMPHCSLIFVLETRIGERCARC